MRTETNVSVTSATIFWWLLIVSSYKPHPGTLLLSLNTGWLRLLVGHSLHKAEQMLGATLTGSRRLQTWEAPCQGDTLSEWWFAELLTSCLPAPVSLAGLQTHCTTAHLCLLKCNTTRTAKLLLHSQICYYFTIGQGHKTDMNLGQTWWKLSPGPVSKLHNFMFMFTPWVCMFFVCLFVFLNFKRQLGPCLSNKFDKKVFTAFSIQGSGCAFSFDLRPLWPCTEFWSISSHLIWKC